jgi:DNA-binding CsgD family transcriptional regulator
LSDGQRWVLVLAKQGKSQKEMAEIMCVSIHTVESLRKSVFDRFEVNSMEQAVIFATNHRLIFDTGNIRFKETDKTKRSKHFLTSEILARIQIGLDANRSVNSLAREEKFSETSLRKAIRAGKLKKTLKNA